MTKRHPTDSKVNIICPTCGQWFVAYKCHLNRGRGKYCSRRCSKLILDKESNFWSRVDKTGCCWRWLGGKDKDGYGMATGNDGLSRRANRLAWAFTHGPIPDGMLVCHTCDNPSCVRPDHLFLGTPLDNAVDRDRKGRCRAPSTSNRVRGEDHLRAKFTVVIVREIRRLFSEHYPATELAKMFKTSRQSIHRIVKRQAWKHVN